MQKPGGNNLRAETKEFLKGGNRKCERRAPARKDPIERTGENRREHRLPDQRPGSKAEVSERDTDQTTKDTRRDGNLRLGLEINCRGKARNLNRVKRLNNEI